MTKLELTLTYLKGLTGMGVYAIERSYPEVGVGQIWKQYLKQLKNHAHLWKLKHCANVDADTDRRRYDWVTTKALQGHSPSELIRDYLSLPKEPSVLKWAPMWTLFHFDLSSEDKSIFQPFQEISYRATWAKKSSCGG